MKRKHYVCKWCGWEWFSSPKALKGKEPKVCTRCHVNWRKLKGGKDKHGK